MDKKSGTQAGQTTKNQKKGDYGFHRNPLIWLARPARLERATDGFEIPVNGLFKVSHFRS